MNLLDLRLFTNTTIQKGTMNYIHNICSIRKEKLDQLMDSIDSRIQFIQIFLNNDKFRLKTNGYTFMVHFEKVHIHEYKSTIKRNKFNIYL